MMRKWINLVETLNDKDLPVTNVYYIGVTNTEKLKPSELFSEGPYGDAIYITPYSEDVTSDHVIALKCVRPLNLIPRSDIPKGDNNEKWISHNGYDGVLFSSSNNKTMVACFDSECFEIADEMIDEKKKKKKKKSKKNSFFSRPVYGWGIGWGSGENSDSGGDGGGGE